MTVPEEGYANLLENFSISPVDYERNITEAKNVVNFVSSRIGNRNFWQVSEKELSFIYAMTVSLRPAVIVETGVGPGTTSYAFLSAAGTYGGKLVSFDLGQSYGDETIPEPVGFVVPESLRPNWDLILGNTVETLPENIAKSGRPSIFMHDSEHTYKHVTFELETAMKYLTDKFLIIVDNFDWTDGPADFAAKHRLVLNRVADDMCYIYRRI